MRIQFRQVVSYIDKIPCKSGVMYKTGTRGTSIQQQM